MFNKPISQIEEKDVQNLIDSQQKESSILEYKKEIFGTDKEKKELPKDISAIANTEGGFFIIGIEEDNGKAVKITGTNKLIGNQPVEEWLENVLISNIRPKLIIKPKVIPFSLDQNKVIIVLQIPQSSRRPHMVTVDGKNAYYKRHNYQASYADEHEVRSMFLETKNSIDEMKKFLEERNLINTRNDTFAVTPLSKEISENTAKSRRFPEDFNGRPFVLFASCPRYLEERIDITSADFRSWLDTKDHIDLFDLGIDFLDYNKEVSSESIKSIKESYPDDDGNRIPRRYVEIFRNGYTETGFADDLIWPMRQENNQNIKILFQIAYFSASFWLFLKFIRDLYVKAGYSDEISIIIALSGIKGVTLHGFGKKNNQLNWQNPYNTFADFNKIPTAKQNNFRFEKSVIVSELGDEEIEKIVKEVATRVSNAFGETILKCFDDNGHFDVNQLVGFRNITSR